MTKILYGTAFDKYRSIINAIDANKSEEYTCCHCNSILKLRNSEGWQRGEKGSKRPHFYHPILTPNCTPESALHYGFKILLYNKIRLLIEEKKPYQIEWECEKCMRHHTGNLLKKASEVKLEYSLDECRPDIILINDSKPFAAIEIIVTHRPEERVISYYEKNNISFICFHLISDTDLSLIDDEILRPSSVSLCTHPKCESCGSHQQKKQMIIIDGPCWKCNSNMKIAVLHREGSHSGPKAFSELEIKFALSKGVSIKQKYSKTAGEEYFTNTCMNCNSFAGEYFLFTNYIAQWDLPREEFETGYFCPNCLYPSHGKKEIEDVKIDEETLKGIQAEAQRERNEEEKKNIENKTELDKISMKGYMIIPIKHESVFCPIYNSRLTEFISSDNFKNDKIIQMIERNEQTWDREVYINENQEYWVDLRFKVIKIENERTLTLIKTYKELLKIPLFPLINNCKVCKYHSGIKNEHVICAINQK